MPLSSEIHSYVYIKQELIAQGWNASNPTRNPAGQVYTQNEALQNPLIKKYLGRDKPEHVIIVKRQPDKYIVIEAKADHKDLDQAINEAKAYAGKLNQDEIHCPIAVGIAGNDEDTYIIRSYYLHNGQWIEITINEKPVTGLLSPEIANRLINDDAPNIKDLVIPDDLYYKKATKINDIFHNGAINKNQRARVMAAMLLALSTDKRLNTDNGAYDLISEINSKVKGVLYVHKQDDFAKYIEISTPPTPENHIKFRRAILDTLQELEGINIHSAMNSGTDILGRFYEMFLKYGNGAKEIGIVLTPRHITRFAVEALNVNFKDKVFDPACGTGGFLVAAFDYVRRHSDKTQLDQFRDKGIYGIEQDSEVVALSLVNMIFRGDGKSNIIEGNCFTNKKFENIKMSKVLMNPPFALKKEDEKEYRFVDLALSRMESGGMLFVVLPSPIMFRGNKYKEWRKKLLSNHTLKAVIKFPEGLFYPVGVHTSGVFIESYRPHQKDDKVLWGWLDDGYRKKKGIMLKATEGNIEEMLSMVKLHFVNGNIESKPKQWIASPINMDKYLECAPEGYLEDVAIQDSDIIKQMKSVMFNVASYQMLSV